MPTNFNDLLATMLKQLDEGKSVEEIIASTVEKEGLSEASKNNVKEAIKYVDNINAANTELAKAKNDGLSREEWLDYKVESAIEALPEALKPKAQEATVRIINKAFDNLQK